MAIMTTIAIIAGVTLVVGGGITAGVYYATEDDRIRARIAEINNEISNCDTIINHFDSLKTKLTNGKTYLDSAKTDFTNGGHVLNGVPLANPEFTSCIEKIDAALSDISNIITRYKNDKSALKKEKRELEAKLD